MRVCVRAGKLDGGVGRTGLVGRVLRIERTVQHTPLPSRPLHNCPACSCATARPAARCGACLCMACLGSRLPSDELQPWCEGAPLPHLFPAVWKLGIGLKSHQLCSIRKGSTLYQGMQVQRGTQVARQWRENIDSKAGT